MEPSTQPLPHDPPPPPGYVDPLAEVEVLDDLTKLVEVDKTDEPAQDG